MKNILRRELIQFRPAQTEGNAASCFLDLLCYKEMRAFLLPVLAQVQHENPEQQSCALWSQLYLEQDQTFHPSKEKVPR